MKTKKMETSASITKFDINDKTLYAKFTWKPNVNDLFHIKMYDGDTSWSGRFSHEFANKYRERFDETEEQYYNSVKDGLLKQQDFIYTFVIQSDDNDFASFSWKKKFEGSALMVHGSVPVHRDEVKESKDNLIDFLLAENKDLAETIETINKKNAVLTADLEECKSDLNKFVEIKTSLERSLYGKFLHLLNSKKRRIQLLEENLTDVSKTNNSYADELD